MQIKIVGKNPMSLWTILQKQYGARSLVTEFDTEWRMELNCDDPTLTYLMVKYGDRIQFNDNQMD